jgi:hypothetical protein
MRARRRSALPRRVQPRRRRSGRETTRSLSSPSRWRRRSPPTAGRDADPPRPSGTRPRRTGSRRRPGTAPAGLQGRPLSAAGSSRRTSRRVRGRPPPRGAPASLHRQAWFRSPRASQRSADLRVRRRAPSQFLPQLHQLAPRLDRHPPRTFGGQMLAVPASRLGARMLPVLATQILGTATTAPLAAHDAPPRPSRTSSCPPGFLIAPATCQAT